jgi:hypothetical protein
MKHAVVSAQLSWHSGFEKEECNRHIFSQSTKAYFMEFLKKLPQGTITSDNVQVRLDWNV